VPGIVDGRSWLTERSRFLKEELAKDPDSEQRTAMEAELAAVEQELALKRRHWRRWLFWGGRIPE